MRRRRRGLLLALLAITCGGLASASVHDKVEQVESRTGSPVPVVVAARDLPAGVKVGARIARGLEVREVPARYAPRDGLSVPDQAVGLELAVAAPRGSYLTAPMLRAPGGEAATAPAVPRGQRLVEVAVSGGRDLAGPARVDVLVTKEGRAGGGRTFVALENVELVATRPLGDAEAADAAGAPPDTLATLRVGARAAVFLTAAQNFARELRLLARPEGDRHRVGPATVGGGL